ncbi:MAG: tetratricopeptide repeat protein, partial [Tepidisphaeraceae bacterium]
MPDDPYNIALEHYESGRLRQAELLCRRILGYDPQHGNALHLLGIIAYKAARHDAAANLLRQAVPLKPADAAVLVDFGNALRGQGHVDEALAAYRQALALKPEFPEAYNNIGIALHLKGFLGEAVAAFHQALMLKPDFAHALSNLGSALFDQQRFDEAIAACRHAVALAPDFAEAHNNLGNALQGSGHPDEAIEVLKRAIDLNFMYAQPYSSLGKALASAGRIDEAVAEFRVAVEIEPTFVEFHSNLIHALHHHPGYDAAAIAIEHHRWDQQHAEPRKKFRQPHANDRNPDRCLRIGYVSADFRDDSLGRFILPLLENHHHQNVEIFAYANVLVPDTTTSRIRNHVDRWRNLIGISDRHAADLIRQDGIDILVDLTLHAPHNRLLAFAYKPAPVQATYLAYPGTSGLSAMDYRLTDPYLDPPGGDELT